jgi:hypothetical protein
MSPLFKTSLMMPLALLLATAPAGACDPEDLKAEYRSLCATATDTTAQLVAATAGRLPQDVATLLVAKAQEAQGLCLADKYDDAMKLAVRVARVLGSAEQEAGLVRDRLAAVPAGPQLARQ